MPGFLLHLNAKVTCAHLGQATPTTVLPNVLLMGQAAVGLTSPYAVTGCVLPPPTVANGPCVSGVFLTSATRVASFGIPLLLQDSQSICAPSGTPLLILVTQTRVFGI